MAIWVGLLLALGVALFIQQLRGYSAAPPPIDPDSMPNHEPIAGHPPVTDPAHSHREPQQTPSRVDDRDGHSDTPRSLYATFPRRLNALSIDTLVLAVCSALVFTLGPMLQQLGPIRIALFVSWWGLLLLYEPLLVWQRGGTVGHLAMNLRVVNNRTGQNVSLLQAVARFWLKAFLGILSFFSMNFSRRHQAIHDIVTGSSVQIRDAAKAQTYHYTVGRS